MITSLLVTLRETLEASLIVGIMLAFMNRTQNRDKNPIIWAGVALGVVCSIALAYIFTVLGGGFEGRAEQIYEGIMFGTAAALVGGMVLWLAQHGRTMHKAIEKRLAVHLEEGELFSIFLLVFTSVLREGVETVIFLQAAFLQSGSASAHLGAAAGMAIAVGAAWLLFRGILSWFPLPHFFQATAAFLILFASGLVVHTIGEFQEAGFLPPIIDHLWNAEGLLSDDSTMTMILQGIFGYEGSPSLLQLIGYFAYLLGCGTLWMRLSKR